MFTNLVVLHYRHVKAIINRIIAAKQAKINLSIKKQNRVVRKMIRKREDLQDTINELSEL